MARNLAANRAIGAARAAVAGVCAAALVMTAPPALADVKAGVDAWSAGDFARAVAEWEGPAAAGDADAMFNLAQAYRLGRGVDIDNVRARKLYEDAASRGHVKAADNYGLMLFQEGEQEKAMPLIRAASDRGDPRAQYVLGLSHFNADYAARDWVRAYALMTLANGAGLPQASGALAQMDTYIPQGQRSQAQSLARELEKGANSQRNTELAAAELGTVAPPPQTAPVAMPQRTVPAVAPVAAPVTVAAAAEPADAPAPAVVRTPAPAPAAKQGRWRVQLGAFGVAANADRMWGQLRNHAALSGTKKTLVVSGKLTRLLAAGFNTEGEAVRACAALKRDGKDCVVTGQS